MRRETCEILGQLESVPWCASCGQTFVPRADWVAVQSFAEAEKSSLSDGWIAFRLMISNRMHRDVSQSDYGRFSQWNAVSDVVQRAVTPLIERVTKAWVRKSEPSKKDRISLTWDIQGMCMEAEFSDLLPPLFFLPRLFECYKQGHRPCGWSGPMIDEKWAGASTAPLPDGKLLVF